jgi:DNA gyrase/topoisomerase IV subunit B
MNRTSPMSLADCDRHGIGSGAELFVVEGESAAAAVARVRDAAFQAVLPIRGKPLNAARAGAARVAGHPVYAALAVALGTGLGAGFDAAGLRFERVLVLMDPDADGIHCGALLLTFFARWMRPLVEAGRVGVVRPPWGEVGVPGGGGERAWSEDEFRLLAAARGGPAAARRYRGLGSIDAETLRATCVCPASRRVERATAAAVDGLLARLGGRGIRPADPGG